MTIIYSALGAIAEADVLDAKLRLITDIDFFKLAHMMPGGTLEAGRRYYPEIVLTQDDMARARSLLGMIVAVKKKKLDYFNVQWHEDTIHVMYQWIYRSLIANRFIEDIDQLEQDLMIDAAPVNGRSILAGTVANRKHLLSIVQRSIIHDFPNLYRATKKRTVG